ncbi:MAG TPA: T9SS type A sorting domain-containing protein [Bacteroidales bacterium]
MKEKFYLLVALLITFNTAVIAQTQYAEWVKILHTTSENSHFNDVLFEGESLLLNGSYFGNGNFEGNELPEALAANGLICKTDLNGQVEWITTVYGSGMDAFYDIAVDRDNNVVLAGWTSTYDTLRVNSEIVLEANGSFTNRAMIMKLSGIDGHLMWIKFIQAQEFKSINSTKLAIGIDNSIYVSGYYNCPFEVDGVEIPYNHEFGNDIFVLKLEDDNNAIWGQYFTAETDGAYASINAIALNDNQVYFAADYSKPLIINGETLPHTGDFYWITLVKLDQETGMASDFIAFGSEGGQSAKQMVIDNNGNVITVGFFSANTAFKIGDIQLNGYGQNDGFVCKTDSDFEVLWANQMGTDYSDQAFNVVVDENNNLFIGGGFDCFTDFKYNDETILLANDPSSLSAFEVIADESGAFMHSTGLYGANTNSILSFASSALNPTVNELNMFCVGNFYDEVYFMENELSFANHNNGYFYKWILPTVTSIDEGNNSSSEYSFAPFPNPANNFTTIDLRGIKSTININDINGKIVFHTISSKKVCINLQSLSPGMYFVQLKNKAFMQTFKLIKN